MATSLTTSPLRRREEIASMALGDDVDKSNASDQNLCEEEEMTTIHWHPYCNGYPYSEDADGSKNSLCPYYFNCNEEEQDGEEGGTSKKSKHLRRGKKAKQRQEKQTSTTTGCGKEKATLRPPPPKRISSCSKIRIDSSFVLAVMNGRDVVLDDSCHWNEDNPLFRGNLVFRKLVVSTALEFARIIDNDTSRQEDICQTILQAVKDQNGRFLMVNKATGYLYTLPDTDAIRQIRRALEEQCDYFSTKKKRKQIKKKKKENSRQMFFRELFEDRSCCSSSRHHRSAPKDRDSKKGGKVFSIRSLLTKSDRTLSIMLKDAKLKDAKKEKKKKKKKKKKKDTATIPRASFGSIPLLPTGTFV